MMVNCCLCNGSGRTLEDWCVSGYASNYKHPGTCPLCAGMCTITFRRWLAFIVLHRICFCWHCWGTGYNHYRGFRRDTICEGPCHSVERCYNCDGLGTWIVKKADDDV